ncbi:MAG: fibronectin type III domain-containing protein [Patescibacteria group bacterium]|nr:fibronectin type III domain-containing protein [Patescibacteria group bacterium]
MKKKIFIFFILLLNILAFGRKPVLAQDLSIVCDGDGCNPSPTGPLFSELNIYPGWNITKTIQGVNNYDQDADFAIETVDLVPTNGLSDVLTISIKKSGETINIYEDNLTNFNNYGFLKLSNIATGESQDYNFTVTMQESADNNYREIITAFNLDLGFELVPPPSLSPATCVVPSAPTNLTATTVSSSVISLSWTAPTETVTHYSISYGLNPGSYIYGANNIGNVTNYTVSGLSSGTTYYFIVYAVTDCGSSSASNEVSATTGGVLGAFIAPGPATGFEVLGKATSSAEINQKNITASNPEILGTQKTAFSWLWLLLLILLILLLFLFYRRRVR